VFRSLPETHFEGTGALYLCEGGQSNRVFLLSARHVPLPPSVHRNELYERKKTRQPRHEVLILGSKAYPDALEVMMAKIGRELTFADLYKRGLAALGEAAEGEDTVVAEARHELKGMLVKAEKTIAAVDAFHGDITKHRSAVSQRVLGHVVYAPSVPTPGNSPKIGL
jgi:hypothetical protein